MRKKGDAWTLWTTPGQTKSVRQVPEFNNGQITIDRSKMAWIQNKKTAASFKATPGPTKTVRQVAEFNNGSRTIDRSKVAWIKHDKTSESFRELGGELTAANTMSILEQALNAIHIMAPLDALVSAYNHASPANEKADAKVSNITNQRIDDDAEESRGESELTLDGSADRNPSRDGLFSDTGSCYTIESKDSFNSNDSNKSFRECIAKPPKDPCVLFSDTGSSILSSQKIHSVT